MYVGGFQAFRVDYLSRYILIPIDYNSSESDLADTSICIALQTGGMTAFTHSIAMKVLHDHADPI